MDMRMERRPASRHLDSYSQRALRECLRSHMTQASRNCQRVLGKSGSTLYKFRRSLKAAAFGSPRSSQTSGNPVQVGDVAPL